MQTWSWPELGRVSKWIELLSVRERVGGNRETAQLCFCTSLALPTRKEERLCNSLWSSCNDWLCTVPHKYNSLITRDASWYLGVLVSSLLH